MFSTPNRHFLFFSPFDQPYSSESYLTVQMAVKKTQRSTMRPQATFSFFIFLQLFHFFTLLVVPSSSSLLSPCFSFLLVSPSSSSLFLPLPALSTSYRFRERPFFIDLDKRVTDGPMPSVHRRWRNGWTNLPTNGQGLLSMRGRI